ncbi:LCP family protein [Bacillus sp. DX1.1]|uniref:LCP family protein n=1 Tax=unclassified Bacillus (in: firmicutes) TaxID=185979 RepID=UPI00257115CC|nr:MULTISPECIES: LCP family protein [unclassified Bacillus (in: firmicutes)]MDM5153536.1 LCP family protein [Bacillus sp. DX1.1]WJE82488.1 LCP family protein [Bacillus sp. DX3.1]
MHKPFYLFLCITILLIGCEKQAKPESFQGAKQEKNVWNVLIIGSDSRGEQQARADTIMVAQYNKKDHTAKLASIMRDSYVEIPSYDKKYNKINAAYYYGGPELLRKTIQHNFGINVSHYVTVDFGAFVKIVDTVAPEGIEVHVTQAIIDDMGFHLQPGLQRLHGKELLKYARFRHDTESDFGRVKRQQEVLQALKQTFTDKVQSVDGVLDLPMMAHELSPYIKTNIDIATLFTLGSSLLFQPIEEMETMRIPIDNGYEPALIEHAGSVLKVHPEKNKEAIQNFFHTSKAVNLP